MWTTIGLVFASVVARLLRERSGRQPASISA
jgi:hypothetical protein